MHCIEEVDKKRMEKKYALINEKAKTIALFERWDASKNITVNFQVIPHFFNIFIIFFHLFQKKN